MVSVFAETISYGVLVNRRQEARTFYVDLEIFPRGSNDIL